MSIVPVENENTESSGTDPHAARSVSHAFELLINRKGGTCFFVPLQHNLRMTDKKKEARCFPPPRFLVSSYLPILKKGTEI